MRNRRYVSSAIVIEYQEKANSPLIFFVILCIVRAKNASLFVGMMLKQIRKFALQDRLQLSFIIVSIVVQVASWGFVFWRSHVDTEWRALGYSVSFGFVTDYGPTTSLYRIPALGLLVLVVNFVLAYMLYRRNESYARVIIGVTAFLEVIVLTPLLAIYYFGNLQ